ncbi:MAG TPA: response regulator [Thermoanaerobaculia bacterium]|nr:response regulator [Thermoanaerobaculia bacterium]
MSNRILIVEDDPTLLFALQDYLDHSGYVVDTASELAEAYAMLMNMPYDVVITDMRLTPVRSSEGLDVIEFIRERSMMTRVVVLTGHATSMAEREARRLGVDRFIRKPVPLSVVADAVSQLIHAEVPC